MKTSWNLQFSCFQHKSRNYTSLHRTHSKSEDKSVSKINEKQKELQVKPGVQELQALVVTAASDTDPGSQTAFLHCKHTAHVAVIVVDDVTISKIKSTIVIRNSRS